VLIDDLTFKLLKGSIKKAGWLELPAYGNSMFPYIQQGNVCRFIPCEPSRITKGDVLLFYSKEGQLVAHRFVRTTIINSQPTYFLKGDTNLGFDEPFDEERIVGKLVNVQKPLIKLTTDHFMVRLWGKMILAFPILSGFLRKFLILKLKLQS
jgi:signal peptidase I